MVNPSISIWELLVVLPFLCGLCLMLLEKSLQSQLLPCRFRRSNEKKFIAVWAGISFAILFRFFWVHPGDPDPGRTFKNAWHLLPNGSLITDKQNYSQRLGSNRKPVIFITPTDYTIIQSALLTRLAQALFPVRDMVQWIVVSLPLETGSESEQIVDEESENAFADMVRKSDEFVRVHLENLDKLLTRFGVPFVVLSEQKIRSIWAGHVWHRGGSREVQGYQTGLLWVLKNLDQGVIMLGDEHFTYHSALFKELQETKVAACWPVGFGPDDSAMTIPLISKVDKENFLLQGYDDGRAIWTGGIKVEIGAFAVDLQYLRENVPYAEYWKLAYSRSFSNHDFNIQEEDIQVMGKGGTEIYVWRTRTLGVKWPNSLPGNLSIWETNIGTLLKNTFGPRYYMLHVMKAVTN